jgi:hypothetical protein
MAERPSSPLGSGQGRNSGTGDRSKINRLRQRIDKIEAGGPQSDSSAEGASISGVLVLYGPSDPSPEVPRVSDIEGEPGGVEWTGDGDWSLRSGADTVYMAQSVYEGGGWLPFERSLIRGQAGQDALLYEIATPEGTRLENSEGRLLVRAERNGEPIQLGEGFSLKTGDGEAVGALESNLGAPASEEALSFYLDAADIGTQTVLRLFGPEGQARASVTLTDLTEAISGKLTVVSGRVEYRKPKGGAWNTGITTLRAEFREGGRPLASDTVSVSWDGAEFSVVSAGSSSKIEFEFDEAGRSVEVIAKYETGRGAVEEARQVIRAIEDGRDGEDNVQYRVRPTSGTVLKNSSGTLGLELIRVSGRGEFPVQNGPVRLYTTDQNGNYVTLKTAIGKDNYAPQIAASDINEEIDVYAIDALGVGASESGVVDSITLTDLTESLVGVVSLTSGFYSYYRDPEGNWQTGTTRLKGAFFQGTALKARSYVDVTWDENANGNYTFSVTKEPSGPGDYKNKGYVEITTEEGEEFGEEGQIIDATFEYTYVPVTSVDTAASLEGISAAEAAGGARYFVVETGTYWRLDETSTSPGTGQVGWDPNGDGTYDGVWSDTGEVSVTVSRTKSIVAVSSGKPSIRRYIRPTKGTVIPSDNAAKELGLEIVRAEGGAKEVLTSGPHKLHYQDDSGNFQLFSNIGLDDYNPTQIGASFITDAGDFDVFLRDTDAGNTLDTITLVDASDQYSSTTEVLSGQTVFTKPANESWAEQPESDRTVQLIGRVFVGSKELASDAIEVFYDGSTFTTTDITHPSETNPGKITKAPNTTNDSVQIVWKYRDPDAPDVNIQDEVVALTGGKSTTDRFIRAENGKAIKDGVGTVDLKIIRQQANEEVRLGSGDGYKIRTDETGSGDGFVPLGAPGSPLPGADPYSPSLNDAQIEGQRVLYLGPGTSEAVQEDSIAVADVTDGLSTGYVQAPTLDVTHFTGPAHGSVSASSVPFTGRFFDSQKTEHAQGLEMKPSDNADGDLVVDFQHGTPSNSIPADEDTTYVVRAQGTVVFDPSNGTSGSVNADNPSVSGVSGTVRELVVEFTGTDPNTGETVSFLEQLQLLRDDGTYRIDAPNGTDIKKGTDKTLVFKFKRFDGNDPNQQVDLEEGELRFVQYEGIDAPTDPIEVWPKDGSGNLVSKVELTAGDIKQQDVVQLQTDPASGDPAVLDAERILDTTDPFQVTYIQAPSGREVTHYTVDEVTGGLPIDPEDLRFTGVFQPPGDSRSTRRQDAYFRFEENGSGDLTVAEMAASGAPVENEAGSIDFKVINEAGTVVYDTSAGTDKSGTAATTDPKRMRVQFTMVDPETGESSTEEEQLEFVDDPGSFYFKQVTPKVIRNGSGTVKIDVRERGAVNRRLTKQEIDSITGEAGREDAEFTVELRPVDTQSIVLDGSEGRLKDGSGEAPSGRIVLDETDIDGDDDLVLRDGDAVLEAVKIVDLKDGTDGAGAIDVALDRNPEDLVYSWDQESETWDRTTDTVITATARRGLAVQARGSVTIGFDAPNASLFIKDDASISGSEITYEKSLSESGQALGLEFTYKHEPESGVQAPSGLTSIKKKETRDDDLRYVEESGTFWKLDTTRDGSSLDASGEVVWNPDGEAADGVWVDTGDDARDTESETITVRRDGEHGTSYNLLLENGNLIKNSQGTLPVEARKTKGPRENRLSKSDGFRLTDGTGTVLDENTSGVSQKGGSGDLYYDFSAGAIDSSTDVLLQTWDGGAPGRQVQGVTLADLTESVVPTVDYTSGPRTYDQNEDRSWAPALGTTTTIEYAFFQGPGADPVAELTAKVTYNGPSASPSWSLSVSSASTKETGASVSLIADGNGTVLSGYAADVAVEYENESGIVQRAYGDVTAIRTGEPGGFTSYVFQRSNGSPGRPPSSAGGTYFDPNPPSGWSDAPPTGSGSEKQLWMSKAVYTVAAGGPAKTIDTTGDGTEDAAWSAPEKLDSKAGVFRVWHPGTGSEPTADDPTAPGIGKPPAPENQPTGRPGASPSWDPGSNGWKKSPNDVTSRDPYFVAVSRYDDEAGSDGSGDWSGWDVARVKGEKGEASEYFYIRTDGGRVVRNSGETVQVRATHVRASEQKAISSSHEPEIKLYTKSGGTLYPITDSVNSIGASDPYSPSISAPQITGGQLTLHLADKSKGVTYDTMRLADLTDLIRGTTEVAQGSAVFTRDADTDWQTESVFIGAQFFRGKRVAGKLAKVTWDGTSFSLDGSVTGASLSGSFSETSPGDVSVTLRGEGQAATAEFTYDDPNASVTETARERVFAVRPGDSTVQRFIRSEDGRVIKNGNGSITLSAVKVVGDTETPITSGNYKLRVKDGSSYPPISDLTSAAGDYEPTLQPGDIGGGRRRVYLGDSANESGIVDSIALADLNDAVSTGYVQPSSLEMTHFNGPGVDVVSPSGVTFTGRFVDVQGGEHAQEVLIGGAETSGNELEISWGAGAGDADVSYAVKAQGEEVSSPLNADSPSQTGVSGPVEELLVEFEGTDPHAGDTITFAEQLQLPRDFGIYRIDPQKGTSIKDGSNQALLFGFKRSGEPIDLQYGELKLVRYEGGDQTNPQQTVPGSSSASPVSTVEITPDDIAEQDVIQLQTWDGQVLDSERLVDLNDGVSAGYVTAPKGTEITYFTDGTPNETDDTVAPSPIAIKGTYAPPTGSTVRTVVDVHASPNGSEIDAYWTIGPQNNLNGGVTVTNENGKDVPPDTTKTSPSRWTISFDHNAETADKVIKFSETVRFNRDFAEYLIEDPDDQVFRINPDGDRVEPKSLTFRGRREGSKSEKTLSVDGNPYSFALFDDTDSVPTKTYTGGGTSVEVGHEDVSGSALLQLRKGSATVESLRIIDQKEGTDGDDAPLLDIDRVLGPKEWVRDQSGDWAPSPTANGNRETRLKATFYKGASERQSARVDLRLDTGSGTLSDVTSASNVGSNYTVNVTATGGGSLPARSVDVEFVYEDPSESKPWQSDVQYGEGDVVSYEGSNYICTVVSTTVGNPPDGATTEWDPHDKTYRRTRQVTALREGQDAAEQARISAGQYVFIKNKPTAEEDWSVSEIGLTAKTGGLVGAPSEITYKWETKEGGGAYSAAQTQTGDNGGDTFTVSHPPVGTDPFEKTVRLTVTDGADGESYTDVETFPVVQEGSDGIVLSVANDTHAYPVDQNGDIVGDLDRGAAEFRVYEGAEQLAISSATVVDNGPFSQAKAPVKTESEGDYARLVPQDYTAPFTGGKAKVKVTATRASGEEIQSVGVVNYRIGRDVIGPGLAERGKAARKLGDGFSGLATSADAIGYLTALENVEDDGDGETIDEHARRWRTYLSDSGDLYLNESDDETSMQYVANWGTLSTPDSGLFAVGRVGEAKSFFKSLSSGDYPSNGTSDQDTDTFFGYHEGILALNGRLAGKIQQGRTVDLGDPPDEGIRLDGGEEEIRVYANELPDEQSRPSIAIGPNASFPGNMNPVATESLGQSYSGNFSTSDPGGNRQTSYELLRLDGSEGFDVTDFGHSPDVPVEMASEVNLSITIGNTGGSPDLDFTLVFELRENTSIADGTLAKKVVGTGTVTPDYSGYTITESFSFDDAVISRPQFGDVVEFVVTLETDRDIDSAEKIYFEVGGLKTSTQGLNDVTWRQFRPRTIVNKNGVFSKVSPRVVSTLGASGSVGVVSGGGGGGGVSSFEGRTGSIEVQRSDTTDVVDNQVASTFAGTPPKGELLLQHIFHEKFRVEEAILYANSAPDSSYAVNVDVGTNSQTVSLDGRQNYVVDGGIGGEVSKGDVIRATTASADSGIGEVTISFDLSPIE